LHRGTPEFRSCVGPNPAVAYTESNAWTWNMAKGTSGTGEQWSDSRVLTVSEGSTTAAVQHYLNALASDTPPAEIIRPLLERAAGRLRVLCATLLHRSYPRLTRPPLTLETDEMLGAVVEGLLKAMRTVRPQTVRQFFALANQHMRWQLNDLARRLDS